MQWRIAEVTDPSGPDFDPTEPRKYEITSHWESDELTTFNSTALIPGIGLQAGQTYRVRVRMKDAVGRWSHWSDPVQLEAADPRGGLSPGLQVTEVMYHPTTPTADELAIDDGFSTEDFEFIELTNTSDTTIDLTGVRLRDAVKFDFTGSNVTSLEPGRFVVVAHDLDAFAARYGTHSGGAEIAVAGQFDSGKLSNGGELVTLLDAEDRSILAFTYSDDGSWPGRADGKGSSLEVIDTATDYDNGDDWRASSEYGGSPGVAGVGVLGDVVVNEVLTHTDPPLTPSDSIELLNLTAADIDIGGWYLSDSNDDYQKYRIPTGTVLKAGSYRVFDESHFNPTPETPGLGDFSLNGAHGDEVYLLAADAAGKPTRFVDLVEFPAMANGESFGRWPNGTGNLSPMIVNTLREKNLGPRVGPLLISEVHYNPPGTDIEFIELFNPTSETVDLTNWRVRGGIDFDFAAGTTIAADGTLVIVPFDPADADPVHSDALAAFRTAYSIDASVRLVGPYTGQLSGDTDRVQLQRPDGPPADEPGYIPRLIEDEVIYDDTAPWPTDADGRGSSLNRLELGLLGNDPASWTAAVPSPGNHNIESPDVEVVARHLFYNNSHFDGPDPAANGADDAAIATDKQALLPGQTATLANYTNYSRGINGIMIDIAGLANAAGLSALGDFRFRVGNDADPEGWADAPAPLPIDVRPGEGTGGSDRITIRFDDNLIEKQWLEVTVLPTPATGIVEPDVFYFGNAIGDAGDQATNTIVNATDEIVTRNFPHSLLDPAEIDDPYDYDRDGLVNGTDQIIARNNQTNPLSMLRLIDLPSTEPALDASSDLIEAANLDWLYEFEQAKPRRDASKKSTSAEQGVDQLMAVDWS